MLSIATPPPAEAQLAADTKASTIVILDGSNSMNARLPNDRTLKFVTVRDALRAALPRITPGTEIGLAAFGARRPSDCMDAELIVPPSPDVERISTALERYQPRGFSPVVLALRTAAKALPTGSGKASIVLVIDDLASCRGEDPCAVATDLKRQNPALAIHVVGLGLRPADAQVLACVTRQTGGQLLSVAEGPDIAPAIEQAVQLASLDRPQATPPPSEVRPIAAPAAAPTPARRPAQPGLTIDPSKPGLHLTARLGEGRPVLLIPLSWRVWKRGESEPLVDLTAPATSRLLPNGSYEVEVRSGLVTVRQALEITSQGATAVTMNLNAALLAIGAPLAAGGRPPSDAVISVYEAGGDARPQRAAPVWFKRGGSFDLVVPAGTYRVHVAAGLASAERVVAAGPGTVSEMDMPLAAGRIVAREQAGPTVDAAGPSQLTIETDDPESVGGRRELYRAAADAVDLTLPAGAYIVTLRRGGAEVRERVIVKPGEVANRALVLPFARVRLTSRIGNGVPAGLGVRFRIERLDAAARLQEHWSRGEQSLDLTPGRYRFEARIGAQNALAVREAEIKPGLEYRVELDPAAGGIQLRLAGASVGLGFGDVYWQVFDEQGTAVWRTGGAEPVLALGAGRYRARVELRDRAFERTFDVRPGESRVVEVGG